MPKRRIFRLRYVIPIVVLVAAAAAVPAFRATVRPAGAAGTTPLVAEKGSIEETLLVSGLVKPSVTIEVRAEASGLVETAPVMDGERVSAGQVLVTLDSRVAQTAVQEAEAQLKQAELQLESSRLDADEDTLAVRRLTHNRNLQLRARGLIPLTDVEASELQVRLAERSLERARRNLLANEARIEQLRAQLQQRQAQLQYTIVRSPIEQTRLTTFPIVIDVTTDEGAAWINVPAQAEIVLSVKKEVVVIPDHCLRTDPSGKSSVLVQENGAPASRPVQVGTVSRERVEVTSGLDAGQTVLCRGEAK